MIVIRVRVYPEANGWLLEGWDRKDEPEEKEGQKDQGVAHG